MALLPVGDRSRVRGAHASGVLALAFRLRELFFVQQKRNKHLAGFKDAQASSSPQNAETRTPQACAPRKLSNRRSCFRALLFLLVTAMTAAAEQSPVPQAASSIPPKSVRISFLPPPLEGTISLGIYGSTGKLVRVLHREAELDDFTIGQDALSTVWDGKNDAGEVLPPGKYRARGYAVGRVEVEGIGFFFNDWVRDEESPRIRRVHNLKLVSENEMALLISLAGGEEASASCDLSGKVTSVETEREDERFLPDRYSVRVISGKLSLHRPNGWEEVSWPDLTRAQDAAAGKEGSVWVLDRSASDTALLTLKQFSKEGAFLRQMLLPVDEPQPKVITASTSLDRIFLLEENAALQRVRGLTLISNVAAAHASQRSLSDWKIDFEKKIVAHRDFTIENRKPVVSGGKAPVEKITIRLQANPLKNDQKENLELFAGYDADGSFLKTADGLPLQSISETPHLTRVVLSPQDEESIDVFQDDDAVVEQFRINELDQMMAFDCGEIELK